MSVEIKIDTENAAFESGEALELAHVLQDLADELSRSGDVESRELRDSSGQKVGQISFGSVALTTILLPAGDGVLALVGFLFMRSAYVSITPYPDNQYQIQFKPEHADAVARFLAGSRR